jgi:hypothetical protein
MEEEEEIVEDPTGITVDVVDAMDTARGRTNRE